MAAPQVMKSRWLLNLFLLLALVGLGLFAWLRPGEHEDAKKNQIHVTNLAREQVTRIGVHRKGEYELELEKRGNTWYAVRPWTTRVNELQVERLLDVAAATASGVIPTANLSRYGLDTPPVVLTLNDLSFAFGNVNEITNEQYLAADDKIFLIRSYYGYNIPYDLNKVISDRLLGAEEKPVAYDFGKWKAIRTDKSGWTLEGQLPSGHDIVPSPDSLNVWVAEWQQASALSATPSSEPGKGDRVVIRFASGSEAEFRIIRRDTEVHLLRTESGIVYRLGAEAGSRLLDPYRVAAN